MAEQPEKSKEQKLREEKAAKETGKFLMNLVLFAGSSLVTKMAWNIGLANVFPRLPSINYGQAVSWLLLLYIASRIVAAGWMSEIEKAGEVILSTAEEVLNKFVVFATKPVDTVVSSRTDSDVN